MMVFGFRQYQLQCIVHVLKKKSSHYKSDVRIRVLVLDMANSLFSSADIGLRELLI